MQSHSFVLKGQHFTLSDDEVRQAVAGSSPGPIREYSVSIDGQLWPVNQVYRLATGATPKQFVTQTAVRHLSRLGFAIQSPDRGEVPSNRFRGSLPEATSNPATPELAQGQPQVALPPSAAGPSAADVVLISCVKSKAKVTMPAKDLYISDYFTKMRRFAEASGAPWFILSAEHGLLTPDEQVEPYETYLPDTPRSYRVAWGQRTARALEQLLGPLTGLTIEVHAGSPYVVAITPELQRRGAIVRDPLAGLRFGERLHWYGETSANLPPPRRVPEVADHAETAPLVAKALRTMSSSMSPAQLLAMGRTALREPGLYSWWVDEAGADDLTDGLGLSLEPGLIYAGQAGATRESGQASSNTLWDRLVTMHLGGSHQLSTLRLTLGSILAEHHQWPTIDEPALTEWMHHHLRVIAYPAADRDSLRRLEDGLLQLLDPPLNLAKVPQNPIRQRVKALRRQYGARPAQ